MALVDLAWHIYMFSQRRLRLLARTIDEPMSAPFHTARTLMGRPRTEDFSSSAIHRRNPQPVHSLSDSKTRVYVLKRFEDRPEQPQVSGAPMKHKRFVSATRLDTVNRAGTTSKDS